MSYAAAMLSRAMAYPTEALKAAAIRAINYLVQHKSLCWTASKSTYFSARHRSPKLRKGGADATIDAAFSDADFAAGPSMSGWAVLMAGAVVDYGAKRQSGTMLSSAGSEIVAGSVCATYIMNKRLLLAEHGFPLSGATTLYMDRSTPSRTTRPSTSSAATTTCASASRPARSPCATCRPSSTSPTCSPRRWSRKSSGCSAPRS